jgi:hypothetical protein
VGFLIKKYAPEPEPRPSRKAAKPAKPSREEREPVIVHQPSCRAETFTVRALREWDGGHLARWEDEVS